MPTLCLSMEQADPIQSLFAKAKAHRVPMSRICEKAGVDPTTPSRWRRGLNGATVERVQRLHDALGEIIASDAQVAA